MSAKRMTTIAACIALGGAAYGCGASEPAPSSTDNLAVNVAPLTYLDASDACYTLTVYAGAADPANVVWSESDVCASSWGAGGEISYVGPCVAGEENTVELVLQDIYESPNQGPGGTPIDDSEWENPCPAGAPCSQSVLCVENADVPVPFDLTVLRDANQGFFDIAVNFDDIFCSAKFDCARCDDAEPQSCEPIDFLHNPATGERDTTVILAVSCTAGAEDEVENYLHMEFATISCDDGAGNVVYYPINPMGTQSPPTQGNQGPIPDFVFQHQITWGAESIPGFDKDWWTIAVGLDTVAMAAHGTCTLSAAATASNGQFGGGMTPDNAVYPVIQFEIPLNEGGGDTLSCTENPLNGDDSGVFTSYTPMGTPHLFPFYQHDEVVDQHCWCDTANGYEFNPEEDGCVRVTSVDATDTGNQLLVCDGQPADSWTLLGAMYHDPAGGTAVLDDHERWTLDGGAPYDGGSGYLSELDVFAREGDDCSGDHLENTEWIGFTACLDVPTSGDYLVGVAGDNYVQFRLNGQTAFEATASNNFIRWHVSRLSLSSGPNVVELFGRNDTSAAGFGAEIYGPFPAGSLQTAADMQAALANAAGAPDPEAHVFWSTRDIPKDGTTNFDTSIALGGGPGGSGITCPDGYALNTCVSPSVCSLIEHDECQDPTFIPPTAP